MNDIKALHEQLGEVLAKFPEDALRDLLSKTADPYSESMAEVIALTIFRQKVIDWCEYWCSMPACPKCKDSAPDYIKKLRRGESETADDLLDALKTELSIHPVVPTQELAKSEPSVSTDADSFLAASKDSAKASSSA